VLWQQNSVTQIEQFLTENDKNDQIPQLFQQTVTLGQNSNQMYSGNEAKVLFSTTAEHDNRVADVQDFCCHQRGVECSASSASATYCLIRRLIAASTADLPATLLFLELQ